MSVVSNTFYLRVDCDECARYLSAYLPPIDTYLRRRLLINETCESMIDLRYYRSDCILHGRYILDERGYYAECHCAKCAKQNQVETQRLIRIALLIGELMPRDICRVIIRIMIHFLSRKKMESDESLTNDMGNIIHYYLPNEPHPHHAQIIFCIELWFAFFT